MASKYQKLLNKHVLVIGGTSGIGFGVAEASLASGAQITVSSSNQSRVDAAVEKLKADFPDQKVAGYACDLSKPTVEQDLEALFSKVGKVDHIVYSAGDKLAAAPIQEINYEKIVAAGQVRFIAALLAAKVGSKYLKPGPYSSITLTTGSETKKKHLEGIAEQVPTGRVAQPADVAEAYLFLMKDPSVTGTVVDSNSGALLI
ncbi:putative short-chain dehydrogenase [Diaporthe ampelina]|uniref:Putative short-chain dehydrogenase n=1 Tax=Diaporthe ampelina TaxID=1214573 RepID=A0A0G2F7Q3_9PEZI|nr:putative short-chain dehydrogenase [Diaporthe ampelina]